MSAEIDGTSKGLLGGFAAFTLGGGLASLGSGIFLLFRHPGTAYNQGDFNLFLTSIVLIAVGSLLIITLLLGVLGALKDISNLRTTTLVLLFVLLAVLAVIGAYAMYSVKTGRLYGSIVNDIKDLNANYYNSTDDVKTKVDYLHKHYNCCSFYDEYDQSKNYGNIPDSCCIVPGCNDLDYKQYFLQGCNRVYPAIKGKMVFYVGILTLIAAGVVLLALLLYAALTQRSRAGYASVSRGQLK